MAKSENISPSFVSRILRLAYLSPTNVEAILDGNYPAHLTMKDLMEPFPTDWERQAEHFFAEKPVHPTSHTGECSGRPLLALRGLLLFDLPKSQNFSVSDFIGLTVK
jgi:hypothetical protein